MTNLNHFAARKNVHFDNVHDLEALASARCTTFDEGLRVIYTYTGLGRPTEFPFIFKEQDEPHNAV